MIILTPVQADQVRGLTVLGHALAPKPFVAAGASNVALNGNLGLPESVLTDANHQAHLALLQTLTTIADSLLNIGTAGSSSSDWSVDATVVAACTYNSTWQVGQTISVIVPA